MNNSLTCEFTSELLKLKIVNVSAAILSPVSFVSLGLALSLPALKVTTAVNSKVKPHTPALLDLVAAAWAIPNGSSRSLSLPSGSNLSRCYLETLNHRRTDY